MGFKRKGLDTASVVRAFCEHHDNVLFRELDNLDLKSRELFFWQVIYRTLCFERYNKLVAERYSAASRDVDRSLPAWRQPFVQDYITRQELGHAAGFRNLDRFKTTVESLFESGTYAGEIKFLYFISTTKLPVAASGMFQPDLSPDGSVLQVVNQMLRIGNQIVDPVLHQLCLSILPHANGTILSLCALRTHDRALRFIRTFLSHSQSVIDNFIGLAILKMENVFFTPSFVSSISEPNNVKLRQLYSFGIGEDIAPQEMQRAMNLGLFPPSNLEYVHNLDSVLVEEKFCR